MSVQATTIVHVCKLAWNTYHQLQKAPELFKAFRWEILSITMSLGAIESVAATLQVVDRQSNRKQWSLNFSKLLGNLSIALHLTQNFVTVYLSSSTDERDFVDKWLQTPGMTFGDVTLPEFKRKLTLLVENVRIFLFCLTQAEMTRARSISESEEFKILAAVSKMVLNKHTPADASDSGQKADNSMTGLGKLEYFRDDLRNYIVYLLSGGRPLLRSELRERLSHSCQENGSCSNSASRIPPGIKEFSQTKVDSVFEITKMQQEPNSDKNILSDKCKVVVRSEERQITTCNGAIGGMIRSISSSRKINTNPSDSSASECQTRRDIEQPPRANDVPDWRRQSPRLGDPDSPRKRIKIELIETKNMNDESDSTFSQSDQEDLSPKGNLGSRPNINLKASLYKLVHFDTQGVQC